MKTMRTIATAAIVLALYGTGWATNKGPAHPAETNVGAATAPAPANRAKTIVPASSAKVRTRTRATQGEAGLRIGNAAQNRTPAAPNSVDLDMQAVQPAGSAVFEIPWQSINGGSESSSSTNYILNASVGQSAIGFATSTSYQAGIGYWYGTTSGAQCCACPFQSDFDEDGFITALDLAGLIDILFAGDLDLQDECCPGPRADFDCDGFSTALDLGNLIDHLFAGGPGPCDPCSP